MDSLNKPEHSRDSGHPVGKPGMPEHTILKTVLWILLFLGAAIFATPWLIDKCYKHWLGGGAWMTSSAYSCVPLFACILFFILEYIFFIEPGDTQDSKAGRSAVSRKKKACMVAVPLAAAILFSCLSVFQFHLFSTTGVESFTLTGRTEYRWDDVNAFTLEDDWYGHLVFKLVFHDGSHAQFIGGATYYAWYTSQAFDSLYPDTDNDYAKYLAKELTNRNIPVQVGDWDALIRNLRYDSQQELAKELREIIYTNGSILPEKETSYVD